MKLQRFDTFLNEAKVDTNKLAYDGLKKLGHRFADQSFDKDLDYTDEWSEQKRSPDLFDDWSDPDRKKFGVDESLVTEKEWKLTIDISKEWKDMNRIDVKDNDEFAKVKSNILGKLRDKQADVKEKAGKETASLYHDILGKLKDADTAAKFHKVMHKLYDLADETGIYISAVKESEEMNEARSIGKVNIKKLNKIIFDEWTKNHDVEESEIVDKCPVEWWDLWEAADSEIRRIIYDQLASLAHDGKLKENESAEGDMYKIKVDGQHDPKFLDGEMEVAVGGKKSALGLSKKVNELKKGEDFLLDGTWHLIELIEKK